MKKKIYIGFDDTLVDSTKLILEIYNQRYKEDVSPSDVQAFELMTHCSRLGEYHDGDYNREIEEYYSSDHFWNNIKPKGKVTEVLNQLKEDGFELILVSNGGALNLEKKLVYTQEVFPMFDRYLFLCQNSQPYTKRDIDMSDCVFIDDTVRYLSESKAAVKIMFGKNMKGNRNPGYFNSSNWADIHRYIQRIYAAHAAMAATEE